VRRPYSGETWRHGIGACSRLKLWPLLAARAKERMLRGKADPTQISAEGKGETRDEVAKAAGVSHDTWRARSGLGLSAARRQRLHLEVADAIERTYSAALEDYCAELAHHYARSSNTEKTVQYLDRAGRQAIKCGALKEAELCLKQAIATLSTTPETPERITREFNLQYALWRALSSTREALHRSIDMGRMKLIGGWVRRWGDE